MKKRILFTITSLVAVLMMGCGKQAITDNGMSNITINKDSSVDYRIRESFSESYYDINELSGMITEEITSYNNNSGEQKINLIKADLNGAVTDVELTFLSDDDYSRFNGIRLFVGKGSDLLISGLSGNPILTSIKDSTKTISWSDLLNVEKEMILIYEGSETVFLPGKIRYASDNGLVSEDKKSVQRRADSDQPVYVVYK